MPIYEYVCQECQHRFEVKQSFSDPPVSACVRCGQAVSKVISAPAIMFKGSGWYITDYSNKLKPASDGKPEDKSAPAEKKTGESAAAPAASSGAAAPSTSGAKTESSGTSAPAASSAPAPAAPAPSKSGG